MKIPRDVSSTWFITQLKKFGYEVTRQTGSHIRLTTHKHGLHRITLPNHDPIRIGTLSSILNDIAQHFEISKKELLGDLFE